MRLLILLLLTTSLHARERVAASRLLICLGAQEKKFHLQKASGAYYDLNQRLIGELIQAHQVDANPTLLRLVCQKKKNSALHLLQAMLLDPKGWHVIQAAPGPQQELAKELVRELNEGAPEILLNFLAGLQMQAPTSDCLEKHVPGIKKMYEQVKWLQEEVDLVKITNRKKRLAKIFAGIQSVDQYYKSCAAEKAKKTETGSGKPSVQ